MKGQTPLTSKGVGYWVFASTTGHVAMQLMLPLICAWKEPLIAQNLSNSSCGGDSMSSTVNINSLRKRGSPSL